MLKDSTYKEKFAVLGKWMPVVLETIKKDLKNDHIKKDYGFTRFYFAGQNPAKLTTEQLVEAYSHAIENHENAEGIAEFIANRWLLKNSELYYYFEQELSKINPDFSELKDIDKTTAMQIMEKAIQQFGAISTYLFCVLNSVVFPDEIYKQLNQKASQNVEEMDTQEQKDQNEASLEQSQRNHDQQLARLTDKYEKKLQGLQKKYHQDIEMLKKQIATLQRKLAG